MLKNSFRKEIRQFWDGLLKVLIQKPWKTCGIMLNEQFMRRNAKILMNSENVCEMFGIVHIPKDTCKELVESLPKRLPSVLCNRLLEIELILWLSFYLGLIQARSSFIIANNKKA